MNEKIVGMSIGALLIVALFASIGVAFAQDSEGAPDSETEAVSAAAPGAGYVDADDDGVCDNAGDCPYKESGGFADADGDGVCDNSDNCQMRQKKGGCHGSEGCIRMKDGFKGGCHMMT